ncbi:ABC-type fe3+ transport system protein [Neofusicoccum parvum]|nr:ABC-type fe3+ transport system protein [Neofusicoccum parvum]
MVSSKLIYLLAGSAVSSAFNNQLGFNSYVEVKNRTLNEIYQAALKEGGTLTVLKQAFKEKFPGMTLNITVDLSKYHDINFDRQLAADTLYVDSIILQTLYNYPRWKSQGYINGTGPTKFSDYLKPEFKNKLVLTYPNDDQNGLAWFDALLAQNPRWMRGTGTPATLVGSSNGTYTASFTTSLGLAPPTPFNISFPTTSGQFVTWPQTGAILRDAKHPESAKLLHSFILSEAYQNATGSWSVRRDVAAPAGYPNALEIPGTDPTKFGEWMVDRAAVERLQFFFEDRIGTATGESPLEDDL